MKILYSFFINIYGLAISIASLFNKKAKDWKDGRKSVFEKLEKETDKKSRPIWFHCASLGEYEQAKPLIELIKTHNPDIKIITTFFSPSGYAQAVKKSLSDWNFYLPLDTPKNAKRFIEIVNPRAAIFVKYEFWFNYIEQLHRNDIPFYYISAIFRDNQYFFKGYGKWFANRLKSATHFFVQNEKSVELLKSIDINQVTLCGDTRFDRVKKISDSADSLLFMEKFSDNQKVIVAGSTWNPDEELLAELLNHHKNLKIVVAPHEISRRDEVLKTFSNFKTTLYSSMNTDYLSNYQVIIIDTIGILNRSYRYSYVSYIGGAFKTGLHNTLEAAVYGKPLFFGPKYDHFNEAVELVNEKGAFSVTSWHQMSKKILEFETNQKYYDSVCKICLNYVERNLGAAEIIYEQIKKSIL